MPLRATESTSSNWPTADGLCGGHQTPAREKQARTTCSCCLPPTGPGRVRVGYGCVCEIWALPPEGCGTGCCLVCLHWLDRRGAAASPTPGRVPGWSPAPPGRGPWASSPPEPCAHVAMMEWDREGCHSKQWKSRRPHVAWWVTPSGPRSRESQRPPPTPPGVWGCGPKANLVDPASSHMLRSRAKPCMSQCTRPSHSGSVNGSLHQQSSP